MPSNMNKPTMILPAGNSPLYQPYMPVIPDPSMQGDQFDQIVKNRGIRFIHSKAVACGNEVLLDDHSHSLDCPHCNGSMLFYYQPREIIGYFHNNSSEKVFQHTGMWEFGTAMVTMPTTYDSGEEAEFSLFDKLEVMDFDVRLSEKKTYEKRSDGMQQLRYPVNKIDAIFSFTDSSVVEYLPGVNFNIVDKKIQWVTGMTPPDRAVMSISYYSNPTYKVLQPMHELRVSQQMVDGGTKVTRRLPQAILVKRMFYPIDGEKRDI
jgi:hypothetical protein